MVTQGTPTPSSPLHVPNTEQATPTATTAENDNTNQDEETTDELLKERILARRRSRRRQNRLNPRRRARIRNRRLRQTRLLRLIPPNDGHKITAEQDFGDPVGSKLEGVCRITGGNLAGFDTAARMNGKAEQLRAFIRAFQADIHCGQESNLNFRKLPPGCNLRSFLRTNRPLVTAQAHNERGKSGRRQWGGTFVAAFDQTVEYVVETGKDTSGLGRWSWIKFMGKNGHVARVVSAYRPNRTYDRRKHETVYNQHRIFWATKPERRDICPLILFDEDLRDQLIVWRSQGEKLLVFMDGNCSTHHVRMQDIFHHPTLQMQEVVSSKHPLPTETATCQRGERIGRHQIDGVWATRDIPVQRATFLAFHKSPGDHRHAVIDIKWEDLLGEPRLKVCRPPGRKLITSNRKATKTYLKIARRMLRQQKILPRLQKIYRSAPRGGQLSMDQQTKLDAIDKEKTEILRHAEKKCRQLCMGNIDFSPEVEQARKLCKFWHLVWKKKSGRGISPSTIRTMARKLQILAPLSCSLDEAKHRWKQAAQDYELLKPLGGSLRTEWLRLRTDDDNLSEEQRKRAAAQLRGEEQRDEARQIKAVIQKISGNSVFQVEAPNTEGDYTLRTDRHEVEAAIMTNNEARFRLTETTPMLQPPLRDELGLLGATDAAKRILAGDYQCPEGTDDYTRWFVETMKRSRQYDPLDVEITKEDFVQYWKRAKEGTSSSLSGLHFGHYKAASECSFMSEVHALTCQLAYGSGFSLTRWQAGLSVMLEKEKGVIRVDKLRAILLMEADFNFANKLIFGSRMVRRAIHNKEIPKECYGSVPAHEAIEVGINRRLLLDISRQRRAPMAIASVDAHTCYDRISHTVASICCQRWGVPLEPIRSMLGTIQSMKFFLRTGFGDSDDFYGGTPRQGELPFQGICQGNGGGPAIWLTASAVLVMLLKRWGHITELRTCLTQIVTQFVGLLFVDDTDLIKMAEDPNTPVEDVIEAISAAANCWRGGLQASGGDLKPSKTSWGLAVYNFTSTGKFGYSGSLTSPAQLTIGNPDEGGFIATRVEPDQAVKAVGLYQALDGNMKKQLEVLKTRADKWGDAIHAGWLPRRLAWKALKSHIWPSLKYPLPATTFTKKEGYELLKHFYNSALPTMGTCANFPRDMLFTPISYQGMGLPHPFVEQGIEILRYFLIHANADTYSGDLYRGSLEQLQLEVGMGTPVFDLPFKLLGSLATKSLMKTLWEFVSEIPTIELASDEYKLVCGDKLHQRINDELIMEVVQASGLFSTRELLGINRCRLYYHAVTLADIFTGDGRTTCDNAYHLRPVLARYRSKYCFPREFPGRDDRRYWKRAMDWICDQWRLLPALGPWTRAPHRPPNYLFDPTSSILYESTALHTWIRWRPRAPTPPRRGSIYIRLDTVDHLPGQHLQPATGVVVEPSVSLQFGGTAPLTLTPPEAIPSTIASAIASLDNGGWALRLSKFPSNGQMIAEALQQSCCHGVTDGSYMAYRAFDMGTAAWFLENWTLPGIQRCRGVVATSGEGNMVNAYRSELQGMHTMMLAIYAICMVHRVTEGGGSLGCDNETTVFLSQLDSTRVTYVHAHIDLIRSIRKLKSLIPVNLKILHVRGHQDKSKNFGELDRMSQLNVEADSEAKRYLRHRIRHERHERQDSAMAKEGWRCYVQGKKVSSNPTELVRRGYWAESAKAYYHNHNLLSKTAFDLVDWEGVYEAMVAFPDLFCMWVTKHVTGWCGTNRKLYQWDLRDDCICPCCDTGAIERPRHLMICPSPQLQETWETRMEGFSEWCIETDTSPEITDCFLRTLQSRDPTSKFSHFATEMTLQAALEQETIGWFSTLEGRISKKWQFIQERYWLEAGLSKSIRTWNKELITNLLHISHAMWTSRNTMHVHKQHKNGLPLAEGNELTEAVITTYREGDRTVLPEDRDQFTLSLATILDFPHFRQQTWLDIVRQSQRDLRQLQLLNQAPPNQQTLDHYVQP